MSAPRATGTAAGSATPALEVRGLTRRFGGLVALDDLAFAVDQGETRCVIGPNGAGKTTLLNVICGLVRPSSGQVWAEGREITRASPVAIARAGMIRSFQTPTVFPGLPVAVNVELGSRHPGAPAHGADERRDRAIEQLGFSGRERVPAGELSHGERKRLELAVMLAGEPRILLLDEPTAGMSIHETDEVVELLERVCGEMTVVIIEHDMSFVRQIANRVTVLHYGALLMEGTLAEVQADERVRDVYLGAGNGAGAL